MKITKDKDILSVVSTDVDSRDINFLAGRLMQVVKDKGGHLQGCSAIQIREPKRCFIMRDPFTKEFTFVSNPKVLFKFGARLSYEGCLSVSDRHYIMRPIFIVAQYYEGVEQKRVTKFLGWKKARIFMHEYDHLNGRYIGMKRGEI